MKQLIAMLLALALLLLSGVVIAEKEDIPIFDTLVHQSIYDKLVELLGEPKIRVLTSNQDYIIYCVDNMRAEEGESYLSLRTGVIELYWDLKDSKGADYYLSFINSMSNVMEKDVVIIDFVNIKTYY